MCPVEALKSLRRDTRNTRCFIIPQLTHGTVKFFQGDMGVERGRGLAQADELGGVGIPFSLTIVYTGEMFCKNLNILFVI